MNERTNDDAEVVQHSAVCEHAASVFETGDLLNLQGILDDVAAALNFKGDQSRRAALAAEIMKLARTHGFAPENIKAEILQQYRPAMSLE